VELPRSGQDFEGLVKVAQPGQQASYLLSRRR
jgi:hypothetical protein